MKKQKGFTLAEVLITLTIIAVIAVIAITSIYKNYQRRVVATKITEFYRTFEKVLDVSQVENGNISTWVVDSNYNNYDADNAKDKPLAEKYITPYLKLVNGNRASVKRTGNNDAFYRVKQPNGNQFSTGNINLAFYELKNGICIYPNINPNGSTKNGGKEVGQFYVDINCEKTPNMLGKDVFVFSVFLDENTNATYIAPFELPNNASASKKTQMDTYCASGVGYTCTHWLMKDGFNKIPKDYPWL